VTILEVAQKYGHARSTLSVGDNVLMEGGDSVNDICLILCDVAEITGNDAKLRQREIYYISGQVAPRSGEITRPVDHFNDSIAIRLQKQNAFFRWLADELRK
jgi:hypothetical protein